MVKNDFEMIVKEFPEKEKIKIYAVADVHLGAIEHNEKAWKEFCEKIKDEKNAYIILVGDLVNNSTRDSVANPFEEKIRPREQKYKMVEYLDPIKDKILCGVSGNHEGRSSKKSDIDITYDIFSLLGKQDTYRENAAYLKVCLGNRGLKGKRLQPETSFVFVVTHGQGGGNLTGGAVNKNERYAAIYEGVDCVITGHTHKGAVTKPAKICVNPNKNRITTKTVVVLTAESWLGYGGYAIKGMFAPAETCNPQTLLCEGTRLTKKIQVIW